MAIGSRKKPMHDYKTIVESKNFIVLDQYKRDWQVNESYQSESVLEQEFIEDLRRQGYEYGTSLKTPELLLANVRVQLQALNSMQFADSEWLRFVETYLDKPSDGIVEKTRKIMMTTYMILYLMMVAFKTSTC